MSRTQLQALSTKKLLTMCLWAEARGERVEGQQAVCNVILNRVARGMARTVREVILAPKQFSWTNSKDPNHIKALLAETNDPEGWRRAADIAGRAIIGGMEDLSKGADHYLNVALTLTLRGALPRWAQKGIDEGRVTVKIGNHTFLNLKGRGKDGRKQA